MDLRFRRSFAAWGAVAAIMALGPQAHAVGALAIGDCGAYGYSDSASTETEANQAALDACQRAGGKNCEVKETVNTSCAALAVDKSQQCGATGWGRGPLEADAESVALQYCRKYGGQGCRIVQSVCDGIN
jgi:hypothetical protein